MRRRRHLEAKRLIYNALVSSCLLGGRGLWVRAVALPVGAALLATVCGAPPPKPVQKEVVVWKQLGEWSGHGNAQTESFIGLTGALRMHWRTKNEVPKGAGTFRLILQSAISGRDLQAPVDQRGVGEGTAYAADDPRVFQISVESANLDWAFTVEEALFGSQAENPKEPH
jgi:hypothetical protein